MSIIGYGYGTTEVFRSTAVLHLKYPPRVLNKKPWCVYPFAGSKATTESALPDIAARKIPLIVGTTGCSDDELNQLKKVAGSSPVMYSTNYSIGVNVLFNLVKLASAQLKNKSEVEIVEKHHRYKKDSPSGTAVTLGEIIAEENGSTLSEKQINGRSGNENIRTDEIAFHALRGGNIVGDHSVQFILENEIIDIRHEALNRKIFTDGAVSAIPFMLEKKSGFYHISDSLK